MFIVGDACLQSNAVARNASRMTARVRKTIVLPADLAREVEAAVPAQGKTLNTVIEDALRQARIKRWRQELRGMQNYWSRKARDQGILTEIDVERCLGRSGV